MSVIVRDLIEYSGIDFCLPCGVTDACEIQIDDEVILAEEKPDIKQISKVIVSGYAKNERLVKTAVGKNLDGAEIKGFKYIVEVVVSWRIEYVACDYKEAIYSIVGESSVNAVISLPTTYKIGFTIIPSVFINDVNVLLPNKRLILLNLTGVLIAEQD